jgi:hypothetical protein
MDADSLINPFYITEINNFLKEDSQNKNNYLLASPQYNSVNNHETNIFGRFFDLAHVGFHFSFLYSPFGVSLPMSNYSVSYTILKEVNFFDIGKDYIAEDAHTALKIVNKTSGRVQVKPIYAFSNQTNLASSGSFFKDFLSKFWQS